MKLKVCGQKHNIQEVAQLQPDYLGFIFWEPSTRYFDEEIPKIPDSVKKIGVFVDAPLEEVLRQIETHNLDGAQLHGQESAEFCKALRHSELVSESHDRNRKQVQFDIIKVFSIKDTFNFSELKPYEGTCDYFLFDTKGKLPGGNGYTFDWSILKDYPSNKPFFLSGGIGLGSLDKLKDFLNSPASKYCHAIDVNSRFESKPGLKNIEQLKEFQRLLTDNRQSNTDNQE
ncbi:phosphoribosylanthranilate isomerase [Flagellimonas myxillae]|uniref:phosphoribosylanthranilate isomerase n=1 Tax=Flagellimonas myxillae TaxID=2942214 RepID=UPI00201E7617|nr:phosphoribosylanthranilate isomerase [Muricauda myxillae]MCL6267998.1 phosphoribosylanthranilate isomerase [Muricauda myxillae]